MIGGIDSIQIIGTQRSGSNLLRLMLNQFEEISAPHPPHVLKTFAQFIGYYGDLKDASNFHLLAKDVADFVNANPVPWSGTLIEPDKLISRARHNTLLSLYETLYQIKAEADKAKIWCCKSMFNEYYAREIEAQGIRPFYIYLYRDGRDVAASFKRAIIGPKHTYFLAKNWLQDQEKALQVKQEVDPARFYMIKYEELIQNPEAILRNLSAKLGLEYTPKVLEYHKSGESKRTASSGDLWKNVNRPVISNNQGKFKSEISAEELLIYESVAGEMLERLGYEQVNKWKAAKEYTMAEIDHFKAINEEYQAVARSKATEQERDLRKKQEEILVNIKGRFSLE